MRSRSSLSGAARRGRPVASEISPTLVAVKSASGRGRAESIRDVVDAYRRLYGSVQRFALMLGADPLNVGLAGTSGSHSLNPLLSILADRAKAATFARLSDLKTIIEDARPAEQLRDAIFSDASSNDVTALRKVVAELERLDAAFVCLCVGHVLEQHTQANGDDALPAAGRPALARRRAAARESATSAKTSPTARASARPRKAHAAAPELAHLPD